MGRATRILLWLIGTAFVVSVVAACVALTGYSVSGLIGFGHYSVTGATDMVWWRQTHIVADILCGIAILAFAIWAAARGPRPVAAGESAEVESVG